MRAVILVLTVAACGPGGSSENASATFVGSSAGSMPSDGTACGNLAAEYQLALKVALACNPSAPNECTEWRPLAMAAIGNSGNMADAKVIGLCFTAYVGYVTPAHTHELDAIIARYKAAGCTIGYCPGPSPHETRCMQNATGSFTCGGL
jgi:hypothetical protein